jgi:hypothetical protein
VLESGVENEARKNTMVLEDYQKKIDNFLPKKDALNMNYNMIVEMSTLCFRAKNLPK